MANTATAEIEVGELKVTISANIDHDISDIDETGVHPYTRVEGNFIFDKSQYSALQLPVIYDYLEKNESDICDLLVENFDNQ